MQSDQQLSTSKVNIYQTAPVNSLVELTLLAI